MINGSNTGTYLAISNIVDRSTWFSEALAIAQVQFSKHDIYLFDLHYRWIVRQNEVDTEFPTFAHAFDHALQEFIKAVKGEADES